MKGSAKLARLGALIALSLSLGLLPMHILSQELSDQVAFLPVIAAQPFTPTPTPSLTPTPTGFIGWRSIHGRVFGASSTTPSPLSGAVVSFTRFSYVLPYTFGMTLTLADGSYAFAQIPLRDSDTVHVYAQADGYTPKQTQRNGIEMQSDAVFDFVLVPWPPPIPAPAATGTE